MIAIEAFEALTMLGNGKIIANGGDAIDLGIGSLGSTPHYGSGGGGAGSIYIAAASLAAGSGWQGKVSATGGKGTAAGGGGGGGGYIHLQPNFARASAGLDWLHAPDPRWASLVSVAGGTAGVGSPPTPAPPGSATSVIGAGQAGGIGVMSGIACSPGHYGVACQPCAKGHAKDWWGAETCTPCPMGTAQGLTGQAHCTACSLGSVASSAGLSTCSPCLAGSYGLNATTCEQCDAGMHSNASGRVRCDPCPAGLAAERRGMSDCHACPYKSYANASALCDACPPPPKHATIVHGLCTVAEGSRLDCSCYNYQCSEPSFVAMRSVGSCGPLFDVVLLEPFETFCPGAPTGDHTRTEGCWWGEIGRAMFLALPTLICGLLLLYVCYRIAGTCGSLRLLRADMSAIISLATPRAADRAKPEAGDGGGEGGGGDGGGNGDSSDSGGGIGGGGGGHARSRRSTWLRRASKSRPLLADQEEEESGRSSRREIEMVDVSVHKSATALASVPFAPPSALPPLPPPQPSCTRSVRFSQATKISPLAGYDGSVDAANEEGGGDGDGEEENGSSVTGGVSESGQRSLLSGGAPYLESLAHAVMWDEKRQLASRHVSRVHLLGVNSAERPWRLPKLRRLQEADRRLFNDEEYTLVSHLSL